MSFVSKCGGFVAGGVAGATAKTVIALGKNIWCWYNVGIMLVWCWYGVSMVLVWCWCGVSMVLARELLGGV
jgi:hypothetical protein